MSCSETRVGPVDYCAASCLLSCPVLSCLVCLPRFYHSVPPSAFCPLPSAPSGCWSIDPPGHCLDGCSTLTRPFASSSSLVLGGPRVIGHQSSQSLTLIREQSARLRAVHTVTVDSECLALLLVQGGKAPFPLLILLFRDRLTQSGWQLFLPLSALGTTLHRTALDSRTNSRL